MALRSKGDHPVHDGIRSRGIEPWEARHQIRFGSAGAQRGHSSGTRRGYRTCPARRSFARPLLAAPRSHTDPGASRSGNRRLGNWKRIRFRCLPCHGQRTYTRGLTHDAIKLLGFQIGGATSRKLPNWRWIEADRISDLQILDQRRPHFVQSRPEPREAGIDAALSRTTTSRAARMRMQALQNIRAERFGSS